MDNNKTYFVMSDIHGFYDVFIKTLEGAGFDRENENHCLIICGDVFDRGKGNKEMFEYLSKLPADRFIYIRGNHEDLLEECVYDILGGRTVGIHHFSNGTVGTIAQFCGLTEDTFSYRKISDDTKQLIYNKVMPVLKWIDRTAVDYKEISDYIFVHGWIPTDCDGIDCFGKEINPRATNRELWDNVPELWKWARWANGMEMWHKGVRVPNKTIVCGHFHTSYYWSHIKQKRKEFPPKNRVGWEKSFEIVEDDGIIALDTCCAYTNMLGLKIL